MILWNPKIQLYKDTPIFPNSQICRTLIFEKKVHISSVKKFADKWMLSVGKGKLMLQKCR